MTQGREPSDSAFRFRVSDVMKVPLRGVLLRLRLVDGTPSMKQLGVGAKLRLRSPDGREREARIVGHAMTGGRATQARLERARELDVLVDTNQVEERIETGWMASGPVN